MQSANNIHHGWIVVRKNTLKIKPADPLPGVMGYSCVFSYWYLIIIVGIRRRIQSRDLLLFLIFTILTLLTLLTILTILVIFTIQAIPTRLSYETYDTYYLLYLLYLLYAYFVLTILTLLTIFIIFTIYFLLSCCITLASVILPSTSVAFRRFHSKYFPVSVIMLFLFFCWNRIGGDTTRTGGMETINKS